LGAPITRITIAAPDAQAIRALVERAEAEMPDLDFEAHLDRFAVLCHELPEPVRTALVKFRLLNEPSGGLVLSGLPIDFDALGPTTLEHLPETYTTEVRRTVALHFLLASLLGDPMSQAGVRDGQLIQDIRPLPGDEATQLASSSEGGLEYHCEDAYHDLRPDWILLMCLRNPDGVPTTFCRVRDLPLPEEVKATLFQKRFVISPDSSHDNSADTHRVAVLSGDHRSPFVRIDPAFMPRHLDDEAAEKALATIIDGFDGGLQDVVLAPGEVMIIDNLRTVHGRRPFVAHYDGNDRWLRSLTVAADLRRSEGMRTGPYGRAVKPQQVNA
jgi:hypothetical protein